MSLKLCDVGETQFKKIQKNIPLNIHVTGKEQNYCLNVLGYPDIRIYQSIFLGGVVYEGSSLWSDVFQVILKPSVLSILSCEKGLDLRPRPISQLRM